MINFALPDIGEGVKDVTVTDILISVNQSVKKDDILLVVESEKASMEIPSDVDCVISEILVKKGDVISPGEKILILSDESETSLKSSDSKKIVEKPNSEKIVVDDETVEVDSDNLNPEEPSNENKTIYASPSVRKLARELDCILSKVKGTGKNGRITSNDVYSHTQQKSSYDSNDATSESVDNVFNQASKWGFAEKIELNNIKLSTSKKMVDSWNSIPHVTQFDECDITELDKIRKILRNKNKDINIKVSFIPFFMKAVVKTMKELTIFNSSLSKDKKHLIQKKYYNIGIAVNTERGLLVPVIKDVDKKSIRQLSRELTSLVNKARNKRLSIEDMSGGCMTISSLGGISGNFFTPIINSPEVAILGISKIEIKPILIDNKFKPRKMLPISLSYDHRVVDGVDAAQFTKLFSTLISKPKTLID